ncbi:TetR/AcrR family transcriptional regulator [Paracoccus jeotgali]|uniref:TetR/AcrR family transcriptional regulator n=1 Tax=Paracoccus jeotgali TaxID=2065379 RepID=A0A2K9MJV3_9RHOB|nr:TetR/AcrR family transcriptional regulator [Paracoccus jeotgali]
MLVCAYLQEGKIVKRKPAEDRKTEIVEAVLLLADLIGPDRLTTNDVAREVGVTQAAIFRHFPSKDALWAAVGAELQSRLNAAWQEALAAETDPEARLRALIRAQLTQIERTPALPAILHSRELGVSNGALRESCHGLMISFSGLLSEGLAHMAAQGQLRPHISHADGAILLISLVQGLAIRWALGARQFDFCAEGMRLFEVQLALFRRPEGIGAGADTQGEGRG